MDASITAANQGSLWGSGGQYLSFRHELLSFTEYEFCCVPVNAHSKKEKEEKRQYLLVLVQEKCILQHVTRCQKQEQIGFN